MVSKEVEPVYIPTSNIREFQLLFLPTFGIVNLFHFKHSGGYVVVSHCGFNLECTVLL